MDAPAVLYAFRWLIRDTFRQALMSRVFWILLAASGLAIVFCLGVSIDGGAVRDGNELYVRDKVLADSNVVAGRTNLLFGFISFEFSRTAEEQVRFLHNIFASWIAGTAGLLMVLVWTAGFVPEALQPSAAAVMLAKPVPRWVILTGKYLGVVCFVALHASIFFLGTWVALDLRTNIWTPTYLAGIPLIVFQFAVLYSLTVMLAVLFRSTMACVVGTVLFWLACYAINYGRDYAVVYEDLFPGHRLSSFTVFFSELSYWLLPKPVDMSMLMEMTLNLGSTKETLNSQEPFAKLMEKDLFHPILSIISSWLFSGFALWTSATQLAKTDY